MVCWMMAGLDWKDIIRMWQQDEVQRKVWCVCLWTILQRRRAVQQINIIQRFVELLKAQ